jgi:hypothetical protein
MKKSVFDEWNIKRKIPIFLVGVLLVSCSIASYFIGISVEKKSTLISLKASRLFVKTQINTPISIL